MGVGKLVLKTGEDGRLRLSISISENRQVPDWNEDISHCTKDFESAVQPTAWKAGVLDAPMSH